MDAVTAEQHTLENVQVPVEATDEVSCAGETITLETETLPTPDETEEFPAQQTVLPDEKLLRIFNTGRLRFQEQRIERLFPNLQAGLAKVLTKISSKAPEIQTKKLLQQATRFLDFCEDQQAAHADPDRFRTNPRFLGFALIMELAIEVRRAEIRSTNSESGQTVKFLRAAGYVTERDTIDYKRIDQDIEEWSKDINIKQEAASSLEQLKGWLLDLTAVGPLRQSYFTVESIDGPQNDIPVPRRVNYDYLTSSKKYTTYIQTVYRVALIHQQLDSAASSSR